MEGWIVLAIIAAAVGIFVFASKAERRASSNSSGQSDHRPLSSTEIAESIRETSSARRRHAASTREDMNLNETEEMIYFANGGNPKDREYRFKFKKVEGAWRAYITRTPSFGRRDTSGTVTHRLFDSSDNDKPYVCWDTPIYSLKDVQAVSRAWADCIQQYIATGKRFG